MAGPGFLNMRWRLFVLFPVYLIAIGSPLGGARQATGRAVQQITPPPPVETPAPLPTSSTDAPADGTSGPPEPAVVSQIFSVVFSADTLFDAIATVLEEASSREIEQIAGQTAQLTSLFAEILQPPPSGHYAAVAGAGLRTAAALGPVLFIVRLALYHWNRLVSEDDRLTVVLGDWVAAGFTAVAAGPFLDSLVAAGWWAALTTLGETAELAGDFLSVTLVGHTLRRLPYAARGSLFSAVFAVAGGLGGLVGAVGLAYAFAVAQAVLFLLGLTAPVIAVIAVLPQTRWLRGLWLKAATILALLPVVAGGIFKGAVALAVSFTASGLPAMLIRLFWLWGAAGFMLSLAGVLGKFSITSAVESAGKLVSSVQSVLTTALAASGSGSAISSYGFGGETFSTASGFSAVSLPTVAEVPAVHSPTAFNAAYDALVPHLVARGLDPTWMREAFPNDTARMVDAYLRYPDRVRGAADPLAEAAALGGATRLSEMLSGEEGRA